MTCVSGLRPRFESIVLLTCLLVAICPREVRLLSSTLKFRCLAGLQSGVLGGLLMLLYFSVDAILRRQHWASPQILFGTAVYGNGALWHGTTKVILAGVGLQIVLAGIAGILCSLIVRPYRTSSLTATFVGLSFAISWYFLCYFLLLPRIAPLISMYISRSAAIAAHLLLGLFLSRAPAYFRQLHPEPPSDPAHVDLLAVQEDDSLSQPSGTA